MSLFPAYGATDDAVPSTSSQPPGALKQFTSFANDEQPPDASPVIHGVSSSSTADSSDDSIKVLQESRQPHKRSSSIKSKTSSSKKKRRKRDKDDDDDEKRSKKKKKHRKEPKSKKKRKRHSSGEDEVNEVPAPKKPAALPKPQWSFLKHANDPLQPEYMIDTHRDSENLVYKELYARHQARYWTRYRQLLGANSRVRYTNPALAKRQNTNEIRYYNAPGVRSMKSSTSAAPAFVNSKPSTSQNRQTQLEGFIQLEGVKKKDTDPADDNEEQLEWDESIQMYRVVEKEEPVIVKPEQMDDDDEDAQKDAVVKNSLAIENILERSHAVNTALNKTHQHDVRLWLYYVQLQDGLYKTPGSVVVKSDTDQKIAAQRVTERALCERKLAIIDKAIKLNHQALELRLKRLQIGSLIWESAKLAEEWRKLEFTHVNQPEMWRACIQFSAQNFATFDVSRQLNVFDRCLSKLHDVMSGSLLTHPALPGTSLFVLEVLLRRTYFLRSAGHTERAWANLQAAIEFNYHMPDHLIQSGNRQAQLLYFEPFWDSGAPRFGESGSVGWAKTLEKAKSGEIMTGRSREIVEDNPEDNLVAVEEAVFRRSAPGQQQDGQLWSELECLRQRYEFWPWQLMADGDEEPVDPDRQVLYDDVQGSLIYFADPTERVLLLLATLRFLGVELDLEGIWKSVFHETQLSPSDLSVFIELPPVTADFNMMLVEGRGQIVKTCFETMTTLCESSIADWLMCVQLTDARRELESCEMPPSERVKQYKRLAKDVIERALKQSSSSSLRLYACYALNMHKLGASKECLSILSKCLASGLPDDEKQKAFFWMALHTYLTVAVETSDDVNGIAAAGRQAASFLMGVGGGKDAQTTTVIKAKRMLNGLCSSDHTASEYIGDETELTRRIVDIALGAPSLHRNAVAVMLNFCTTHGRDRMLTCDKSIGQFADKLKSIVSDDAWVQAWVNADAQRYSRLQIALHDAQLRLTSTSAPRDLHACLRAAVSAWPDNAYMIQRYVQYCVQRVRLFELLAFFHRLQGDAKREPSEMVSLAEIYAAFLRYISMVNSGGSSSCTRSAGSTPVALQTRMAFERATDRHPNSVQLWRLWLKFESLLGAHSQVERVMYVSIGHCPWSIPLYVDCVRHAHHKFTTVHNLCVEKMLRIRLPVEEFELLKANYWPKPIESPTESIDVDDIPPISADIEPKHEDTGDISCEIID